MLVIIQVPLFTAKGRSIDIQSDTEITKCGSTLYIGKEKVEDISNRTAHTICYIFDVEHKLAMFPTNLTVAKWLGMLFDRQNIQNKLPDRI